MQDQASQLWTTGAPGPAERRATGGGSLLLVLFVLAALPPVTLAQGLERQAVLELIESASFTPRHETHRELRRLRWAQTSRSASIMPSESHRCVVPKTPRHADAWIRLPGRISTLAGAAPIPRPAHLREEQISLPPPRRALA